MNVIWTRRAEHEYESVILYLLEEWTPKEAQKFITNASEVLKAICKNPNMYKSSKSHPYLRKAKISKHQSYIYQLDNSEIIVLRVLDHRSDELH